MDEREALTRAVAASPDDDLPRLVFADWLDERGEVEYAAFVRTQVEYAATPPWEPFAVRLRNFEPDLVGGGPWWYTLPRVDGHALEWHPEFALRRGFAHGLKVRDVTTLLAEAPALFEIAPIAQLHLPSATLDQWKRFAAQPWLPRVRSIHFYGTRTPIEPVRVLCDAPLATGLEEIVFEKAGSHAIGELVAGLLRSPLGYQLRSLEFRSGYESLEELLVVFDAWPPPWLDRLAFVATRFAPEHVERLARSSVLDSLSTLEIVNSALGDPGLQALARQPRKNLKRLTLSGVHAEPAGLTALVESLQDSELLMLDLSSNWPSGWMLPAAWVGTADQLRVVTLGRTTADVHTVQGLLVHAEHLTELNLDHTHLPEEAVSLLHRHPAPPDLTCLSLRGVHFNAEERNRLRERFGGRLLL